MPPLLRTLFISALLGLGISSQALARELIIDRAFVEDPSGSWALEEARVKPLTPFTSLLAQGYGKGAIWVRLRIDPGTGNQQTNVTQFLRIRPIFLDSIQLFDEAEGFVPRPPLGDRHPLSESDEPGPFYLFELQRGSASRELWLRIESSSSRLAHFEVLDELSLKTSNLKLQTYTSIYLALIASFVALGILQALIRRDTLNWSFTLYQIMSFVHGAIALGYARWWADALLIPEVLDRAFSLLIVGLTFVISLYSNTVLRELSHSRHRDFMLYGLFIMVLSFLGMQFAGLVRMSLALNALAALILPAIFLIDAILQSQKNDTDNQAPRLSKLVVVTYFALTLALAYVGGLPALGWSPAAEFSLYWLQVYCLSSGLLMLGLLQYRAHMIGRQRDALVAETRSANERAALERAQRVERQQLLNMLGHELKTPMATLKMLLGDRNIPTDIAQRLGAPLMEMKDVVERTVQSGQLDEGGIELRWQACNLPALIEEQLAGLSDQDRVIFVNENPAQESAVVQTDPHFLGVIIRNLLDNALKYSPDNSKIQLRLAFAGQENSWRLTVNNEVGRAGRPDPEKLFVKYWRSPDATYRSGSGQGLYIVYRLADLLGGRLSLGRETELVSFTLEMPVATGPAIGKQE